MIEPAEPERDPLHAFDQIVDGFDWPVRCSGPMPVHDLGEPSGECASEGSDLNRERVVLEICRELVEVSGGVDGVGDVVEEPDGFLACQA